MPDATTLDEALLDAHARWLGLTIDPAWRPTISQIHQAFAAATQFVDGLPMADEDEPAPVFKPCAQKA